MFVEAACDLEESSAGIQQIVEVHGAGLVRLHLRHDDRVHGPADDAAFDECARVDADHSSAVIKRVEVVGARLRVDGIAAPQHGVRS